MENEELKRILSRLSIPEHGYESKNKAITSAIAEFRHHAQKRPERSKGFSLFDRLISKKSKGIFFMNKSIAVAAGTIAICVIAFAVVFSTTMISQMTHNVALKKVQEPPLQNVNKSSKPVESGTAIQQNQELPQATENKVIAASTPDTLATAQTKSPAMTKKEVSTTATITKVVNASPSEELEAIQEKRTQPQAAKEASVELASAQFKPSVAPAQEADGSNEFTLYEIAVQKTGPRADVSSQIPGSVFKTTFSDQALRYQQYVGRDKFEDIKPNPVKLVSEEPVSTFSIDVDTASYAFVRRALYNGNLPQTDSVRIEEMINYFDYDYPLPQDHSAPFKPTVAVFPTPWNPNTKLLHIGIKGYDIVPDKKPKANLVFLIDVSGSMESDDKLPLLKNSLRMLVDTLKPDDTVAIVTYAGSAATALERTKGTDKAKIMAAIDRLHAGGSTAGAEGIRTAYSLAEADMDAKGVNRVILATDGDFNVGIADPEALKDFVERKRKSGIYLSVLGFGQGNYNDTLMQKLAQNGNGNAAYIDNLNEARKVLVDEASGTLFTIAKDVKIQIEFNPYMVSEYRLIGYETRLLNREDFKNDNVDAGDIGSGHSVTAIYEITPKGSGAQLIDDLRYGSKKDSENDKAKGNSPEYAFLKIRYKLPDETSSREISTAIDKSNEYKKMSDTPEDSRFAAAVAAFGQLLRGDSYINKYTYDDVINLAKGAVKNDDFGYRTEFLNLVRLAKTAAPMGDR